MLSHRQPGLPERASRRRDRHGPGEPNRQWHTAGPMSEPAAVRPVTKRDEQREASRRRLLNAAVEILAEEGYLGLTVKKVGERAGVSRGMVNYHFTSKAGLVEAVVADIRETFIDVLRAKRGY